MKIRAFETQIRPLLAFNLNDIRKIDPGFHRQQLSYWLDKCYVKPLAGGYYQLAEQDVNEAYFFMLANRMYAPSYISLESALAYYQVIPESVLGVINVSSRKTQTFDSPLGRFSYRSLKPTLMFGFRIERVNQQIKFKIARLEKALLDYLYLHPAIQSLEDFEGLRWNTNRLLEIDHDLFSSYQTIFGSKTLAKRVGLLEAYLHA